jgi:hypothetical protein
MGTVNIITQGALRTIVPYKKLVQRALGDIGTIMLQWIEHSNKKLIVDGVGDGERVTIDPKLIDKKYIYVTCDLIPAEPIDMVSRAQTAQAQVQAGASMETSMETMQIVDPQAEMERRKREDIQNLFHNNLLKKLSAQGDAEALLITGQAQLQLQQMGAEMQQEMAQEQAVNAEREAMAAASREPGLNEGGAVSPQRRTREQENAQTRDGTPTVV